jgi:hypothetical protein
MIWMMSSSHISRILHRFRVVRPAGLPVVQRWAVSNVLEAAMRHHQWVSEHRHAAPAPVVTLGWTQFTLILIIIAAVLLLTGAVVLPI